MKEKSGFKETVGSNRNDAALRHELASLKVQRAAIDDAIAALRICLISYTVTASIDEEPRHARICRGS